MTSRDSRRTIPPTPGQEGIPDRPGAPEARQGRALPILAAALMLAPAAALAQLPGLPVVQGGFVRPGGVAAANYGTGDDVTTMALAGSWTPRSSRFTMAAAIGLADFEGGDERRTAGGLRVGMPVLTRWTQPTSAFGVVGFIGVGGVRLDGGNVVQVPAGVGVGYRRRLGDTRAVALSATPFYAWYRTTGDAGGTDSNLFRATLGADLLVTRSIGVTAAYELGATAEAGSPGPTGGLFGVGVSYAF